MDPAILQSALTYIGGALSSGLPMWIMLRKSNADIRKQNAELVIQISKANQELTRGDKAAEEEGKINTEASWKRILDERNKEIVLLKAKDDEQEKKIEDLLNKHIECKSNEARQEERSKNLTERCDKQEKEIRALQNKILSLDRLLRKQYGTESSSDSSTHQPLALDAIHADQETRNPGTSV